MKQSYALLTCLLFLFTSAVWARNSTTFTDPPAVTVNNNTVCAGASVTLTATGAGTITWHTTANGSDAPIETGTILTITPATSTTYYAKATSATDPTDTAMSTGTLVTVNQIPSVIFSFDNNNACSGTTIHFNSSPMNGSGSYTYAWDFGDGSTATGASPAHSYNALGCNTQNFNVTLTVTSNGCSSASASQTITVKQRPEVDFFDNNASPANQFNNCANAALNPVFAVSVGNDATSNCITSYSVNWGDGSGTINNVNFPLNHTYTTLGAYNLTLTANGQNGCQTTKTFIVKNVSNPSGGISSPGNTQNLCVPTPQLQFSISNWALNSPGTTYAVNFGDGTAIQNYTQEQLIASAYYNVSNPSASANYPIPHSYTTTSCPNSQFIATLTVTNACGFTTGTIANISTIASPIPNFSNPANACVNTSVLFANTSTMGFDTNCSRDTKYVWNFGDGSSPETVNYTATTPNRSHTYTTPGTYTVTLSTQNGCGTAIVSHTICIENPLPSASFTLNNTTGCGSLTAQATNTTPTAGACNVTYTWNVAYTTPTYCGTSPGANYNYFTGGTTSSATNPSFNFPNPGTYIVTLTAQNSCGTKTATQTVTVKAPPTVTINAIPNVCGGNSATINPTASVTNCGIQGLTYAWSFPGGTPATSSSQNPGLISYTTSGQKTITVTVTNECGTTTDTETFTVNPAPVMASVANQVKCKGQQSTTVSFSSDLPGTTYTWTNSNTAIGLAGSGNTTSIPAFTTSNATNAPITSTITVTPRYNGCDGATQTFTITVNPVPAVNALSNITICNGAMQNTINITSAVNGTTFEWTNSNPAIGLVASGTGNIPQFTATNTGISPIISTITVTPSTNGCSGNPVTFTITVNPSPAAMTLANMDLCNGAPNPSIVFNNSVGGTTYTWTNSNASIGLSASGTGNIPAFTPLNTGNSAVSATITVTPHSGSCNGSPQTFTITVSPSPVVQFSIPNQTICSGETTAPVTLTSPTAGVNFSWTSAGATGITGTATSGTASIPAQTLINNTSAPITIQYNASGALSGGAACPGSTFPYSITIKPKPAITNMTGSSCSGSVFTITPLNGTNGTVPVGTNYTWAAPGAQPGVTGLAAGNNTSSISATLTNSNATPVDITYIVTPSVNGCAGNTFNVTITVQPTPTVAAVSPQTVCNGTNTTAINFTGLAGGTAFAWTNSNPSIGLAANGTGNIPVFAAINNGNTVVTATITVTPQIGTCSGTPQSFTITVNPAPAVTFSQTAQSVCSGTASTIVNLSSTTPGATISWIASQPAGISGVTLSGTNAIPAQTLVNSTTAPIDVTYTATASTTGVSCPGATYTYTITVKPVPSITTPITTTICSGATFTITPQNGSGNSIPSGTQYAWTVPPNNDISGESNQATPQNSISQALTNTSNAPVTVTYTVTPVTNGCNGPSFPVTVTVNPKPFVTSQTATICSGETFNLSPVNGGGNIVPASGVTYSWNVPALGAGITGALSGTDAASVSGTLTNITNTVQTATYTVTPKWTSGSEICTGGSFTVTVTVNPKPAISDISQNACSGAPFSIAPVNGTDGSVPSGTTYSWIAPAPQAGVTGLAAGNNSNAVSGTITNTNTTPVTITYIVTPLANGCLGDAFDLTVTVAPTPTIATVSNQTVCNQAATTAISFTGTVAGTVFNWQNSNPSIGLAATGSGDIASFTATNEGTAPVTATITVTPRINNCDGTPQTFTIIVNPAPSVLFSQNNQTICSGTASTAVNLTSATANTSITWTANVPAGISGATASGTTSIPAQTLVNTTNGVLTVTYTAIAATSGTSTCPGAPSIYTITVTPVPFVSSTEQVSICSGTSPNYIPANSGGNNMPTGVTFTWLAPMGTGFTGGSAQNTPQSSLNQVLVNTTNAPVIAGYTVTPHFGGCNGVPFNVQITINPAATVPNSAITLCSGSSFIFDPAMVATILPVNTVFNWSAPTGNIFGGTAGSAQNTITGTLSNTTASVQPAVYTITPVSPQGSCNGASFTLTVNVNPVFDVTSVVSNYNGFQISSAGANDGSINITPTGGTGSYTYSWSGPNGFAATTQDITNLGPGTYTVVVSDGLCQDITRTFTLIEPMPLVITEVSASHVNVNCFGQSTGVLEVVVTQESIGPYDYAILLANGTVVENVDNLTPTNYIFDNLPAGTYNIRVTDANGTVKFINGIQITQPATGLAITGAAVPNFNGFSISCNGANNGTIDLTVSGGYPGYTYSWTGPNGFTATTQDISGLAPGNYSVTVLDTTNSCPVTQNFTITEPLPVAFTGVMSAFNGYQISCFGGNNGSITITPTGGTGVYIYTWNGPNGFTASSQNLTGISVGTYTLTISDNNGCTTAAQTFTLTQPAALARVESHVNVLCFGAATGSIDVTVTGGVPDNAGGYNYTWTGPNGFASAAEDLLNIPAGIYNMVATDENGCTITLSVTITEQPEIIITPTTTPITCYGANNASITLAITGGNPPYTAAWSNLATGTFQDNLAAGNYVIIITDESGCQKSITVVIPEAPIFTVNPVVHNITCHGAHDGSIALNLIGGIAPVTLAWSDGSTQGTTRNNLGPGTYTATITDGTPCQIVRTFTILEPATLNVGANLTHALDCNDAQTGAINLTVAGGTLPYTFIWSNGDTTEDLNGLTSGTYSVTVTDAGGCAITRTYTITRPDPIILNVTSDLAVNCDAHTVRQTNIAQASGGVPPFHYTWTSGAVSGPFGQYMNTDQNGTVIVTATDSSGCSATTTFEVATDQLGEANFTAGSYAFTTYSEYSIFDPVTFDNLSSGDYSEVGWDFGDGTSSNDVKIGRAHV